MVEKGAANANKGKAHLAIIDNALIVTFEVVDGKVYTPSIEFGDEDFGFALTTKGVSLSIPVVKLTANDILYKDGVIVKTEIKGSEFEIEQKDFYGVFTADKKVDEIVYSVVRNEAKDAPAAEKAQTQAINKMEKEGKTAPIIVGTRLNWNDWSALTLLIKVEAKIAGVPVAEQVFNARINDPVAEAIVKDAKADNTIYEGDETKTIEVAKLVNLAVGDKDAFDFDADLNSAIGFVKVEYKKVGEWNTLATLDTVNGRVTLEDSAVQMQEGFSVQVEITYTYRFGTRKATVSVDMKPGNRPAKK